MKQTSKQRDPHLEQSLRLLKRQWFALTDLPRWRLLRSIVVREHLHTIHYFERRNKLPVRANCGAILRHRRLAISKSFVSRGFEIDPALLRYSLPKTPSGWWLDEVCPWHGPNPSLGTLDLPKKVDTST